MFKNGYDRERIERFIVEEQVDEIRLRGERERERMRCAE